MRKLMLCMAAITLFMTGCTGLTRYEKAELMELKHKHGISVDNPQTELWEAPKSPVAAAALNILPGVGNFYLCTIESHHCTLGVLNLLLWPLSVLWAIPDGAVSANALNERDLLYFYKHNEKAQGLLKAKDDLPKETGDSLKEKEDSPSKEESWPPKETEEQ
jgi:hypothetical protein